MNHVNRRTNAGRERVRYLKNPVRIVVELGVESERSVQQNRSRVIPKRIHARLERGSTKLSIRQGFSSRHVIQSGVRIAEISLSRFHILISYMVRSGEGDLVCSRPHASDLSTWVDAHISGDGGRTDICYVRRSPQDREVLCSPQY